MKRYETCSGTQVTVILSGRSNVFLLSAGGKNILIDSGPGRVWSTLKKRVRKLKIMTIDYLILTHSHFDHAGNAANIKKEYKAKVIIHEKEASVLESGENTIPKGTNFLTNTIVNLLGSLSSKLASYKSCSPDILVKEKLDLNEFGINGYIVHTPGHSPGSQSIIIDDEIAIVGDAMFGVFPGSVFPPFADDAILLVNSWGKLLQTNCRLFLPSHGTENKRELVEKDYNKRQ